MRENQIIARGRSNGKMVDVDLFVNEDKTVMNKYGDFMKCGCTMRSENKPTSFIYEDHRLYCPKCGHELEVVETYDSYMKKEE